MLPAQGGERFCVLHEPAGVPARALVVHVPAFGEEMNKSRHVVARAARQLAAAGHVVLVCDLFGCGDSAGDFGDASWNTWVGDLRAATGWLERTYGNAIPTWLWGHRAGALLACATLPALRSDLSLLLWHPVTSGAQHLAQFLRLAVTADALASGADRVRTARMRDELAAGRSIEIAGYALAPSLAAGLEAARLDVPEGFAGRIAWLEVETDAQKGVSPATQVIVERLQARGVDVVARSVSGPRFWQSVELQDCPALVEATCATLSGWRDEHAGVDRAAA